MQFRPVYHLGKIKNWRFSFRNHWSDQFNENFVFIMGSTWQNYKLKVYQFGLFNFSLCLMIDAEGRL